MQRIVVSVMAPLAVIALAALIGNGSGKSSGPITMAHGRTEMNEPDEQAFALKMFAERPELFPEERRQAILEGRVTLGMTPYEAKLAGGAFAFKVIADPKRWPTGADPFKVMWRQSIEADDSQIWMTFKNARQFPGDGERVFRVHFEHGKALEIEVMEAAK
jgi:hypothetical protein